MKQTEQHKRDIFKRKRIGVLMGGLSAEREVSCRTGTAIAAALKRLGYTAVTIDVDRNVATVLQEQQIEIALMALHGPLGEDGTVQGLLEIAGIPYTGSGVLASALAMSKTATKKILAYHELPTPTFQSLKAGDCSPDVLLTKIMIPLPFVVKPSEGGSTLGISIVRSAADIAPALQAACAHDDDMLVESYVSGREMTVGVLNGAALPLIEVCPQNGFYDFEAKYASGTTRYITEPEVPAHLQQQMQHMAEAACQAVGCRGAARVDFILSDQAQAYILEINTIPGMTETSLLPMAAKHAGIHFDALVEHILLGASLHKSKATPGGTRKA